MEKWTVAAKKADFQGIAEKFAIDQVTARIIRNRDVIGDEAIGKYLYGTLDSLADPALFLDGEKLAGILKEKIESGRKIRIIGDYDIDGVTSTYLFYRGIMECGGIVDTVIPNRMTDGYGLNQNLIQEAAQDGIDTILTCDNGIAAVDAIALGKKLGMTVLVTDHHELPDQLPEADAIVNPKQPACGYPYKELCGAGVAYRMVELLYRYMGKSAEQVWPLVVYAGMGTVGDVVDLTGENRILVREGLKVLNQNPGVALESLITCCGLSEKEITAYHIGFVLGPCINASGRLETARIALKLLASEEPEEANAISEKLVALNQKRKEITETYLQEAIDQLDQEDSLDHVLFVYLPDCHESIAGIIAGRVREKYHRPCFVATKTSEGLIKGSGRSIEAYSMYEKMKEQEPYFLKFGGHPMAAGFSMKEEDIQILRYHLNQNAELSEKDFIPKVEIDVPMPISYLRVELIQELKCLEPFGKGNPKPLFAQKQVQVLSQRLVGKERKFLKLTVRDGVSQPMDAIYFGPAEELQNLLERKKNEINITYYPEINEFQGNRRMQLMIQNFC